MDEPLTWIPISAVLWLIFIVVMCAISSNEIDDSFEDWKEQQW